MSTPFTIFEPFPQFHGRDGQPLEDGNIYVGTAFMDPVANPVQVYWDAALLVPAVQPIKTVAGYPVYNGSPASFYIDGDNYSIRITDRSGSPVFSAQSCAERFPASLLSGGVSAANITYLAPFFGAQQETVTRKFTNDLSSVLDYCTGAQVIDIVNYVGLVDCTDAVNNAINANTVLGRDVYFPPGVYRVSSVGAPAVLVTKNGVSLRGAGKGATIIKNVGTDVAVGVKGDAITQLEGIRISDMTIEGSGASTHGLLVTYTKHSTFERVESKSNGKDGIRVDNSLSCTFRDCDGHNNTENGLVLSEGSLSCLVTGGDYYSNTAGGVIVSFETGATRPSDNVLQGLSARLNSVNVSIDSSDRTAVVGCTFDAAIGTQLSISWDGVNAGSAYTSISSCSFSGASLLDFAAGHSSDTMVSGCAMQNPVSVLANASRTRFFGCELASVSDNGTGTFWTSNSDTEAVQTTQTSIMRLAFKAISNAFRFRTIVAGGTYPILELHGFRIWVNEATAQLMIKGTDPTSPSDGTVIGPGVRSYTVAQLLALTPSVGQTAAVTDLLLAATVWGHTITAPDGGGAQPGLAWYNGFTWTIIGK